MMLFDGDVDRGGYLVSEVVVAPVRRAVVFSIWSCRSTDGGEWWTFEGFPPLCDGIVEEEGQGLLSMSCTASP